MKALAGNAAAEAPFGTSPDRGHGGRENGNGPEPRWLSPILALLEKHSGVSFEHFRTGPLVRALEQEARIAGLASPSLLLERLCRNSADARDLALRLINGTTLFFRDPEVFGILRNRILPAIVRNRQSDQPVRIWVAGCSTGAEAYSLAISIVEVLEVMGMNVPVHIYATDLNPLVLATARAGEFPARALIHVSPEAISRFFRKKNGAYTVHPEIRRMVRFAQHDLTRDRFSYGRLDLISCRNVLMYLTRETRLRILGRFHHALRPGGHLILGKSEWTNHSPLFQSVERSHRFFQKPDLPQSA